MVAELLPKLKRLLQAECVVLESFGDKESFGDMDVLVQTGGVYNVQEMIDLIKEHLKPPLTDTFKNDNVFSFDHKELQIDLIFTEPDNMQIAFDFSKFNDCGNLCGKIAHKFSTKYGFDGLRFVYRTSEEKVLGEITLTKDIKKILEFIGLKHDVWTKGFDTDEQVFDFVISSKYFDADSFKLENLNSINRKRNAKRKMYHAFIEYCEKIKPVSNYTFNPDKTSYRDKIEQHFPGFNVELKKMEVEEAHRKALREKFNGDLVMAAFPELTGAALGAAMSNFKKSIIDFDEYLHHREAVFIMKDFSDYYKGETFL